MEHLEQYEAPEWARDLAVQPTCRTKFSMKPTPIQRWNLPGLPAEFEVFVKREDLTGSVCSGNKIRKLDFLLGEALSKKCDCVVTFGGIGSNHARATAMAARQLGLDSYLFLLSKSDTVQLDTPCVGNYLLQKISGAKVFLLPASAIKVGISGMNDIITELSEKLKSEGRNPYFIPPGGFSAIGSWGYIDAWQEMMQQGVLDKYDDIVMATGTTGTLCGMAAANYLTGSKLKIHGVTVANSVDYCYSLIQEHLDEFKVQANARDLVNVIGGYVGEGYGICTEEDLRLITEVMSSTGLSLDPDFTVKGVKGMLTEMRERPHIFKGRRILYIHTGGVFGLFDGRVGEFVTKETASNTKDASDVIPDWSRLIH